MFAAIVVRRIYLATISDCCPYIVQHSSFVIRHSRRMVFAVIAHYTYHSEHRCCKQCRCSWLSVHGRTVTGLERPGSASSGR